VPWPTPQDYNEAIQSPRLNFSDPELKTGVVETTSLGLPRPISGGFASVYKVRCGQREWAVRCFLREFLDQQQRYEVISKHLSSAKLPYTIGFDFLPQGIKIRGTWYPILKMEWVKGELLHKYINKNLRNPAALLDLANRWVEMIKALQAAKIAHGDLQHGNVLVVNGDFRLIDYDGVFVPALAGQTSHEIGHRNYQHPQRTEYDFGLSTDNFAAWIIYVSLVAFSIAPELWDKVKAGDECLLFRRADFDTPYSSETLTLLSTHKDPRLDALASFLQSLLYNRPDQLPSFDGQSLIQSLPSSTQPTSASGSQGSIPSWLKDYVTDISSTPALSPTLTASEANSTWVLDFIKPATITEQKILEGDITRPRLILIGGAFVSGLLVTFYLIFALTVVSTAVFLITAWLIIASIIRDYYRRSPAVMAMIEIADKHRRQEQAVKEVKTEIKNKEAKKILVRSSEKSDLRTLDSHLKALQEKERRENEQVQSRFKSAVNKANAYRQAVNWDETESLKKVQDRTGAEVNRLSRQVSYIATAESNELASTLLRLQEQAVTAHLQSRLIDHATIHGVGEKLKTRLKYAGIRTAADVEYWRVRQVDGIGDNKAQELLAWRNHLASFARIPSSLSTAETAAIRAKYHTQKQQFEAQLQAAQQRLKTEFTAIKSQAADARKSAGNELSSIQSKVNQELQAIAAQYTPRYTAINQSQSSVTTYANDQCRKLDEEIGQLRRKLGEEQWRLAKTYRELESFRDVSFKNYLRKVLGFQHR
jgi:hypothetical protein